MRAGFQIEHHCPQCGAPAMLEETDRLFTCGFCRVKSYMVTPDVFRYVLPHKAPGEDLLYFPYWRFKGPVFSCVPYHVDNRYVDTSLQGIPSRAFPPSLGVRAQALRLQFATPQTPGGFLPPSTTLAGVRRSLAETFRAGLPKKPFHQALIGETLSLIYAPFYVSGELYDAVLNRPIGPAPSDTEGGPLPDAEEAHWPVSFIPTLCPQCGWDMTGERFALSLACNNCRTIWQSSPAGLEQIDADFFPGDQQTAAYLPFWRMEAVVTGVELATFADLARAANLPRVIQQHWERQPFYFWCPAFKISPHKFLRLARNLVLAQPCGKAVGRRPREESFPITLPAQEAWETLRTILADVLKPPQAIYPRLEEIDLTSRETRLIYLPFQLQGREFIQPQYRLTVSRSALESGLGL